LTSPQPDAAAPDSTPVAKPEKRKRLTTFIVWGLFLLALASCVALVALSTCSRARRSRKPGCCLTRVMSIFTCSAATPATTGHRSTPMPSVWEPDYHLAEHLLHLYGARQNQLQHQ
jgi:hypothetical protein